MAAINSGIQTYNFDAVQDHRYDGSIRWQQPGGRSDVIGMGTADLDYECAPCIKEALRSIWERNVYNYKVKPETYYEAVSHWFQKKYQLPVQREWMSNVPGTIAAVCIAIKKFSRREDYILMQTPYFDPLRQTIEGAGRKFLENPLILRNQRYEIDFDDFEKKVKTYHPAIFLLINPHNPTGRVFTKTELEKMVEICAANGVRIISDEVHFLVTYGDNKHIPILAVSDKAREISIQIFSFSKGFNMMSLPHGMVFIANAEMQTEWLDFLKPYNFHYASNPYAIAAATAAVGSEGEDWLQALTEYLQSNLRLFMSEVERRRLPLNPLPPEAGYLLWIDCGKTNIPPEELSRHFLDRAGIHLNNGLDHGTAGRGFVRMNFAVTKLCLETALNRLTEMFTV